MNRKIDKDNIDQLVTVANELFENVDIKEEDFQEQFDSHLKMDKPMFSKKDQLLDYAENYCSRYEPCPVCYKCRIKGSHIYDRCDKCAIDICTHTDTQISRFIVRDNFAVDMPKKVYEELKQKVIEATGVPKGNL